MTAIEGVAGDGMLREYISKTRRCSILVTTLALIGKIHIMTEAWLHPPQRPAQPLLLGLNLSNIR
jgi:hypothetical protein